MRRTLLGLILIVAASAFQRGEIPPTDDPTHPGQPAWCQNYDSKEAKHNCDCMPRMRSECDQDPRKGGENPKCKVYCRKDACQCQNNCTSMRRSGGITKVARS